MAKLLFDLLPFICVPLTGLYFRFRHPEWYRS